MGKKRPRIFETIILVLSGVHTSPPTTLGLVSILSTNAGVGPAKDPDMLDKMSEDDSRGTVGYLRPKPPNLRLDVDGLYTISRELWPDHHTSLWSDARLQWRIAQSGGAHASVVMQFELGHLSGWCQRR